VSAVRVKICGITRPDDARAAAEAGASAIGMVFWPRSPRCVSLSAAAEIAAAARGLTRVGVFVDQPPDYIARVAETVPLDVIQLHGREDVAEYDLGLPILKAFGLGATWRISVLDGLPDAVLPLLDAHDDERKGGTGARIDWELAGAAASMRPIVLAGGLNAGNVEEAICVVRPHAIDVSSGVERSPGVKDPEMIERLLFSVRRSVRQIPRGLM
jgi:phosphoribosylanthranilate isomerase